MDVLELIYFNNFQPKCVSTVVKIAEEKSWLEIFHQFPTDFPPTYFPTGNLFKFVIFFSRF